MKLYICEECEKTKCFRSGSDNIPEQCTSIWGDRDPSNWKPTDKYEIAEKDVIRHTADKIEERIGMSSRVGPPMPPVRPPRQTPNCAICRWKTETLAKDLFVKGVMHRFCSSQGHISLGDVYNTEECKELFESIRDSELRSKKRRIGTCASCETDFVLIYPDTGLCQYCDNDKRCD